MFARPQNFLPPTILRNVDCFVLTHRRGANAAGIHTRDWEEAKVPTLRNNINQRTPAFVCTGTLEYVNHVWTALPHLQLSAYYLLG